VSIFVCFHATPTACLPDAAARISAKRNKTIVRIIHAQCDCVWHSVEYWLLCVCVCVYVCGYGLIILFSACICTSSTENVFPLEVLEKILS